MGDFQALFAEPRCAEAVELVILAAEHAALDVRLEELDAQQRAASEEVQRLSAELVALERRAAVGPDKADDAMRARLEDALQAAKARWQEPWPERIAGVKAARRELEGRLR